MPRKAMYRVSNWSQYNRSLIDRGNITLWFSDDAISSWFAQAPTKIRRGRPTLYSDKAIETALSLRSLFGWSLRATQGFIEGMITMMDLSIEAPDYSTICYRASQLSVSLAQIVSGKNVDVVIDATGLKVYGEGEWKCRVHGKSKRRTWRKLHLAIDSKTHEIIGMSLTTSNRHDSMETKKLLQDIPAIASVTGDKGYDNRNAYDPIAAKGAKAIIPPRSGAALKKKNISWGDVERNRLVKENWAIGKKTWKIGSKYHRRSLVETGIGRFKNIIGPSLHSRHLKNQIVEARIGISILNRMTHLGMPKSYKV
jgi:IS5 family transposase